MFISAILVKLNDFKKRCIIFIKKIWTLNGKKALFSDFLQIFKIIVRVLVIVELFNLIISCDVYALEIIDTENGIMCKLQSGVYAKDTWCWLDINGDSIAECYRFGSDGLVISNYSSEDGRRTNEKGQLIENGFVVEKFISSGEVRYGEGSPFVKETISEKFENNNEILTLPKDGTIEKDTIINHIKNLLFGPSSDPINNTTIIATQENFQKDNTGLDDTQIHVGKKLSSFVMSKSNCKMNVDKVVIFGDNDVWDDCIELRGTDSYVKFNLEDNNYITFEVAESSHLTDDKDRNIILEMYVNGKFYQAYNEFVDNSSLVVCEQLDNTYSNVELRYKSDISTTRRIYIHNGRVKKIKE